MLTLNHIIPNPAGPRPRPCPRQAFRPPPVRRESFPNPAPAPGPDNDSEFSPLNNPFEHTRLLRRLQEVEQQQRRGEVLRSIVPDNECDDSEKSSEAHIPVRSPQRRNSDLYDASPIVGHFGDRMPVLGPDNRNRVGERSPQRLRDMLRRANGNQNEGAGSTSQANGLRRDNERSPQQLRDMLRRANGNRNDNAGSSDQANGLGLRECNGDGNENENGHLNRRPRWRPFPHPANPKTDKQGPEN